MLSEPGYIAEISSFWSAWQGSKCSSPSLLDWWDLDKAHIKTLSIAYCRRRSVARRARSDLLSAEVARLKSLVDLGHVSALPGYKKALSDLQEFSLDQARGAQVRSRARWVEEGESSSAYFFRLEKTRKAESVVSSLKVGNRSVTSTEDLLAAASDFYQNLYASCDTDSVVQDELLSNLSLSLSPDEADLCEGDLTVAECLKAVQGMAKNKIPGLDGLPAEFYLTFWSVLGSDLVDVLNCAFRVGFLSVSQRRGLINLVFKADDRTLLKNWRPISLLCVDYKIGSRAIAGRLLRVIDRVVSPDQSAGVPGRFIGENVAFVRDAIQYASDNDLPLAVLTLDQEKAFDCVDWNFLFCTLERLGFGPSFCKWVQTLYSGVQSSVIVNGHLSEFFGLQRGVRQGCPLSPLLYVLVAETLAATLKACPRIKGLSLPAPLHSPSFLSQYADDTSILVTSDDSIVAVFEVFDRYELGSGARLVLCPLLIVCLSNSLTHVCALRRFLTVLVNSGLCLMICIGLPLGLRFMSYLSIVMWLIFLGCSLMVWSLPLIVSALPFVCLLFLLIAFVGLHLRLLAICFLSALWPRVFWLGCSPCCPLLFLRPRHCASVMCCLVLTLLSPLSSPCFFPVYLTWLSTGFGWLGMIFALGTSCLLQLMLLLRFAPRLPLSSGCGSLSVFVGFLSSSGGPLV